MPLNLKSNFSKRIIQVLIVLIGLLGSIASIYALFFNSKISNLSVEVLSNTNVLDLNTEVSDLDIIYNNKSLKKSKEELKIMLVKVANVGDVTILKTHYDETSPFGFTINNAIIVEQPKIIKTSNSYLKRKLKIKIHEDGSAYIKPIILDINSSFIIKILILSPKGEIPSLNMKGKIAGISKEIKPKYIDFQKNEPFLEQVFAGGFWVQIAKAFLYFIILGSIIVLLILLYDFLVKALEKKKRKRQVQNYIETEKYSYKRIHEVIFEKFRNGNFQELSSIYFDLIDEEELNKEIIYFDSLSKKNVKVKSFDNLISEGFITKKENWFVINEEMKNVLFDFIKYSEVKKSKYSYWF